MLLCVLVSVITEIYRVVMLVGVLLSVLVAPPAALVTPIENLLTRRTVAGLLLTIPFAQRPLPAIASVDAKKAVLEKAKLREATEAESAKDEDPLTRKLQIAREDLGVADALIADREYERVRKVINALLPVLTFKGYTGESVKSRAEAWVAAGDTEKAKDILDKRNALVRRLAALDRGLYGAQTNDKKTLLSVAELQEALSGAVGALDAVIGTMGCDRRWKSGKCEILPMNRDLVKDLVL